MLKGPLVLRVFSGAPLRRSRAGRLRRRARKTADRQRCGQLAEVGGDGVHCRTFRHDGCRFEWIRAAERDEPISGSEQRESSAPRSADNALVINELPGRVTGEEPRGVVEELDRKRCGIRRVCRDASSVDDSRRRLHD